MKPNGGITILRWGLAFVFFYAAVASLTSPETWVVYIPSFLSALFSPRLVLVAFSLYELILAGFLFWGRKLRAVSLISAITLGIIVVIDFGSMEFIFLNVGLALAALALFEMAGQNK
jgi:hypothetical protein